MDAQVGTTTICSADALTNTYALMDDDLQVQDGTNKWFWLYGETQTTLDITYTTGAAETNNYAEIYIEYGAGSVSGPPNRTSTMTWTRETMEYFDDSANQMVLENWTYRIDGAAAATEYTARIQLPVCSRAMRIYAREVGVAANYGTLTIKANTQTAGASHYNRSLQTVVLEASGITIGDVRLTDGTDIADITADYAETLATTTNALAVNGLLMGLDADAGTPILRALQVAVDNATVSATPNVLVAGGIYKNAFDTYNDNDAVPLHFDVNGKLVTAGIYAEDAQHTDVDWGMHVMGVRNDVPAANAGTDGDYASMQLDAVGALWANTLQPLFPATHFSPNDFSVAYTSNVTITVSGANFTVTDGTCYVSYILYKPTGGTWQAPLINGRGGVSIIAAAGVLTVAGAGTPFAASDEYIVGISYQEKAASTATDSTQTTRLNPAWEQFIGETPLALTNITANTTAYAYLDMATYEDVELHGDTSGTTPTDVLTCTLEATWQDDGTAAASCAYVDMSKELTALASWIDMDFVWRLKNLGCKYVRVKYSTSNSGGNDADLTLYAKRKY